MKNWYLLLILAVFLSISACFDSGTGFDDPCADFDPELSGEATAWLAPFRNSGGGPWIFTSESGQNDTVKVIFQQSSAYCYGNADCFLPSRLERGVLQWPHKPDLYWALKAVCGDNVEINGSFDPNNDFVEPELMFRLNCHFTAAQPAQALAKYSAGQIEYFNTFQFKGQTVAALQMRCDPLLSQCDSFAIQRFVVNRDFGLLEYQTTDGTIWKRQ